MCGNTVENKDAGHGGSMPATSQLRQEEHCEFKAKLNFKSQDSQGDTVSFLSQRPPNEKQKDK